MSEKFNNKPLTDEEQNEIARQIKEGNTSGRLDREDGRNTYWELLTNTWDDAQEDPILCVECGREKIVKGWDVCYDCLMDEINEIEKDLGNTD